MKKYIQTYYSHFGLHPEADVIYDEYEYIIHERLVVANNIHHIFFGASKYEDIDNYMALTTGNHDKAHDEKLHRKFLKNIHLEFLKNNPYD